MDKEKRERKKEARKQELSAGLENLKTTEKNQRARLVLSIIKISLLVLIVAGIPLYLYFFKLDWLRGFRDIDKIVEFLNSYKSESALIYIAFQIVQIVISVIPGQVFQVAAGYLFGFWRALLYAMTGAVLGTGLSFMLARLLGRDFLHIFFGEKKMSYYIQRLNSKRAYTLIFFLYLIPGIPKDMLSYAAGASEMRFKPFILLASVGRLPGMVGCLLIGTMAESGEYAGVGILLGLAVIACGLCIIFRKRINVFLDKFYNKIRK